MVEGFRASGRGCRALGFESEKGVGFSAVGVSGFGSSLKPKRFFKP